MMLGVVLAIITLIVAIILNYTIGIAFSMGEYYLASKAIGAMIYLPISLYLLVIILTFFLAYVTHRVARIIEEEKRRRSLTYLGNFYLLTSIAALVLEIGIITLLILDRSDTPISLFGATIYVYPISLGLGYFLGGLSALYLFLFGENESYGEINIKRCAIIYLLFAIMVVISLFPQNWYGVVNWQGGSVREITSLLLMLLFLLGIIRSIIPFRRGLKERTEPIITTRYKLIIIGFIIYIGFFIFMLIDAITGLPYSIWITPAYICALISFILIYLGFVTPTWFLRMLEKRGK
mgnify:CR=1 FL=1